jgi:hypothetical protein
MTFHTLLYSGETLAMSNKNSSKIEPTKIEFLRSAKGCTILDDGIISGYIRNELNTYSIHNIRTLLRRTVKYSLRIRVTELAFIRK